MLVRKEIIVTYNPKKIILYLKKKGKSSFTAFDLKDKFGNDWSMANWVLYDLTVLGILTSGHHDMEYIEYISYPRFSLCDGWGKKIDSLPKERRTIFVRYLPEPSQCG